jgi:hypothetical protein
VFLWRYLDDRGQDVGTSEGFRRREDAESWMGEAWADLLDRGIEEVALLDEDRDEPLYRMGLGPEPP